MSTSCGLFDVVGGLTAMAIVGSVATARGDDANLRAELEEISRRSIFFGHQSVGRNLLDGLLELARQGGVPLRVLETDQISGVGAGTLAHAPMPENGDPGRKLRSFEHAMAPANDVDVALVKFCYVDFGEETDVKALFARYQATLAALKAKHPQTTFVHVTVPLTTIQGGVKALAKRVLGRFPAGVLENARREEYNELLRTAAQGKEPLFDLAKVESTAMDGRAETFEWKGRRVRALVPGYTDDGGHLVGEGRLRAARQFLSVLASASRVRASASR